MIAQIAVVFFGMMLTDAADAAKVVSLAREKWFLASWADWLEEVGMLMWLGPPLTNIFKHGVTIDTLYFLIAMYLGGLVGAEVGGRLTDKATD